MAGRATRVTGLGPRRPQRTSGLRETPARWVSRAGRFTWWLAETTPRSLKQILFRYRFALLLLLSVVMIAGGALVGWPDVTHAGWVLLAILAGARLVSLIVSDLLAGRVRLALVAATTAGLAIVGLALVEVVVHSGEGLDWVGGWFPAFGSIDRGAHSTEWELRNTGDLRAALALGLIVAVYLVTGGRA